MTDKTDKQGSTHTHAKLREQIESAADAYRQFDNGWISDMKCGDLSHEYLLFVKEPKNVLALLDELEASEHTAAVDHEAACSLVEENEELKRKLEAAEERSEEFLRQARSFREAHESASEIIRKLERNKPAVKLPTTRLWAGKIACYEESEVVAMLEGAGISIAAGIGKGEG